MRTLLTQKFCLMCNMQELELGDNKISDAGLTAFAKAVESGALAALETLDLSVNAIGDAGMSALAKAITPGPNGKGALDNLNVLRLNGNRISDAGLSALAKAITPGPSGKGALDKLEVSWCPAALSPCPETLHVHSSDSDDLFDVPYAGA